MTETPDTHDREKRDMTDRDELSRLVGLVHEATKHLSSRTSALQLYRDARDVAEVRVPGPLGVAIAAELAAAAYRRGLAEVGGSLGASKSTMALAVAVLEIAPNDGSASY